MVRVWVALAALVVAGAVLIGLVSDQPGRALDPTSTAADGSRALVRVLDGFGVGVTRSSDATVAVNAETAVLVTEPDAYSAAQLRAFVRTAGRVVLVRPGVRTLQDLGLGAEPDSRRPVSSSPSCSESGALAAGSLDLPDDAVAYDGLAASCYGGLTGTSGSVAVLGSAQLLQNSALGREGVAAVDVNLLTASRALREVVWLLPGANAAGSGPASIWDLFPNGVYRAFVWTVLVGLLVVLWRARRLGGVVREPLPVVVRAAEVVEGHGRLYERAGARDRAAFALRAATLTRLRARLSMPRSASAEDVAARIGTPATAALATVTPTDDAALLRLVEDLDRLEESVGGD